MHVIVLGGMARVGKTEVADILEMEAKAAGLHPVRMSFSTPVKNEVAAQHNYDDPMRFKEEMPEVYRKECQALGAGMRVSDPDFWVKKWLVYAGKEQAAELKRKATANGEWAETILICDDCRYLNELKAVRRFGALTVFIYAGKRKLDEHDASWRTHESEELAQRIEGGDETVANRFDWSIYNNAAQEDLECKIQERLGFLLGQHPVRFATPCNCPECKSFRFDIQPDELIKGFREAILDLKRDTIMDSVVKRNLLDLFESAIDELSSGEKTPREMFRSEWWLSFMEGTHGNPRHNEYDGEDDEDDDDADDSHS